MKVKWPLHLFTTKGLNALILDKQKEAVVKTKEEFNRQIGNLLTNKSEMRRFVQKSKDLRKPHLKRKRGHSK